MLTAGAQIAGHFSLWNRIFSRFQISLDENLIRHLQKKDGNKGKRQLLQKVRNISQAVVRIGMLNLLKHTVRNYRTQRQGHSMKVEWR